MTTDLAPPEVASPSNLMVRPGPTVARPRRVAARPVMAGIVESARPYQWAKNVAVLIVPSLALFTLSIGQVVAVAVAVVAFCLAASSAYLLNDTADRHTDALHPVKRLRPIASGKVSPTVAVTVALAGSAGAVALGGLVSPALAGVVVAYVVVTAAYSLALKHIAVVDVGALAVGHVLRVVAGAVAVGVTAPLLLVVAVFWGAVFVGLGKRWSEASLLGDLASQHRRVLSSYSRAALDRGLGFSQAASVAAFGLWVWAASAGPLQPLAALGAAVGLHVALTTYRRSLSAGRGGDPTRDLAASHLALVGLAVAGIGALATVVL